MLGLVRNNLILEFSALHWACQLFSFVFLCSRLSLSQGHLCMLRNWGHWCDSWAIGKPLPLRRMIPFWEIGCLVWQHVRPVSAVILSWSKGIMVLRSLGKNQWQLPDKVIGSVRWQCLKRSGELLHSDVCGVEPVGSQCLHPLRLQTLRAVLTEVDVFSHCVYSSGHCGHSKVGWSLVVKERQLGVQMFKLHGEISSRNYLTQLIDVCGYWNGIPF